MNLIQAGASYYATVKANVKLLHILTCATISKKIVYFENL